MTNNERRATSNEQRKWTIQSVLDWTTEYFTKHQIPTPRLDAEVLLAWVLDVERIQLYLQFDRPLNQTERSEYKKCINRRIEGEPVSYIRGVKEFWSLSFKVGPGVMVPRPDTEVLVESVARFSPQGGPFGVARGEKLRILDIGTGSGAIAIALAKQFPEAHITATDISEEALSYAQENAKSNGVETQIDFLKKDFLEDDQKRVTPKGPPWGEHRVPNTYNIIISNPPYIPTQVIETLQAGIKDYEPRLALDGGPDGLDFYRKMGDSIPHLLKSGGLIAVEIGQDQAAAVCEVFEKAGLHNIEVVKDYAGLDRVVVAIK